MNVFRNPSVSAVTHLLTEAALPSSDLTASHLQNFFGCGAPSAPDGIVGIELHESVALLRSLAVTADCRGQGCGTALVAQAERFAHSQGATEIYLLTTTAKSFFERLGYKCVPREEAPVSIQRTQEFTTLCSASSALMVKRLPANRTVETEAGESGARPSR